jgi:hypothetical protein
MTRAKTQQSSKLAKASLFAKAYEQLKGGDDALYRSLTIGGTRFMVQAMTVEPDPYSKFNVAGRRRKFSNPLFITPAGLLHAFPQIDEDLFVDIDSAKAAVQHHAARVNWSICSTTLASLVKSKAYQRWLAEVASLPAGEGYVEPRRSIEETFAIYAAEGMAGLRRHYTRAHAFHLIAKFKDQGLM